MVPGGSVGVFLGSSDLFDVLNDDYILTQGRVLLCASGIWSAADETR
jgi:pseudouridine-5'-phosphate glycosidase